MPPAIAILAVVLVLCVCRIKLAGDEVHALFRTLDVEPARVKTGVFRNSSAANSLSPLPRTSELPVSTPQSVFGS